MQKVVVNVHIVFLSFLSVFLVACGNDISFSSHNDYIDSLRNNIAELRYKNAARLYAKATALDSVSLVNGKICGSAINSKAYADFMMMNFDEAFKGYNRVIEYSDNDIDVLAAEVGIMQICYRTSMNRTFFDYRSNALRKIRRINEEIDLLSKWDRGRFIAAKAEFAIVSHCYFATLGMADEMQKNDEYLKSYFADADNAALRMYMQFTLYYGIPNFSDKNFENLCRLLERAEKNEQKWLCANIRLMMALFLRDNSDIIKNENQTYALNMLLSTMQASQQKLPMALAMKAVEEFSEYGDKYMMIEALAVVASCHTANSNFEESLSTLEMAMNEINSYYNSLPTNEKTSALSLYEIDEYDEWAIMDNKEIYNINECLLSVRHEASCAFAGIEDKYLSDINRNSYLDLLRTTRLNKQIESRMADAEKNAERLYVLLAFLTGLLIVAIVVPLYLNVKWRRKNKIYVTDLTQILRVCRVLMSALPQDLSEEEDVYNAISDILNTELKEFSEGVSFMVLHSPADAAVMGYVYDMPLPQMGMGEYLLRVTSGSVLSVSKRDMLDILLPYISVAIDEGKRIANITDEQSRLEQQRMLYTIYLSEHKRENVVKRTLMSVVNGMFPYMNRMLHELNRLVLSPQRGVNEERRLAYLSELTATLDDYNVALENWIKMSRGELSLHIENFYLSELLAIIAKGEQAFAMKGLRLIVEDCNYVVKADKALTLFMMNTLVENAGKFTQSGGTVQLAASEGENYVEIAVTDTGVGMSSEKIETLLNGKIYMPETADASSSSKRGGFGIMNCKWIIDKYRKTDSLFSVCRMDITSTEGTGSCFSFRLPKGVMRKLLTIIICLLPFGAEASDDPLEKISSLADSVYSCNVRKQHSEALNFARLTINELNGFYKEYVGNTDTISLLSGAVSEINWWQNNLFPDSLMENIYYNLLDVRNETAVAALVLNDWELYRYNNSIYARLYRLVHEDKELVVHYEKMREIANYRHAALAVCVVLLFLLLIAYVVMYVRLVIMERMNTRMLLHTNARLLPVVSGSDGDINAIAMNLAQEIYKSTNEQLCVNNITVLLKNSTDKQPVVYTINPNSQLELYAYRVCETVASYVTSDATVTALPLTIVHSGEQYVAGAIVFDTDRALNKNEFVTLELIASYAASMVYYSTVCLAAKYNNLDNVEEETARIKFEENNMHVRNLVLDNCLSVIKHETIYYPGRIRNLVRQLSDNEYDADEWHSKMVAVRELMDYYNSVLIVLAECAMRQLDDISFSFSMISLDDIVQRVGQTFMRKMAKKGVSVNIIYTPTAVCVHGDNVLIEFLFESILRAVSLFQYDGDIKINVHETDENVRVEILDTRCHLSQDEVASLFVPGGTDSAGTSSSSRMEYLIAKEIIRIHEEATGKRGGRIEVSENKSGTLTMFTLPK